MAKEQEAVYSKDELMAAAVSFTTKPEIIAAAIKLTGKNVLTRREMSAAVKEFLEKEV